MEFLISIDPSTTSGWLQLIDEEFWSFYRIAEPAKFSLIFTVSRSSFAQTFFSTYLVVHATSMTDRSEIIAKQREQESNPRLYHVIEYRDNSMNGLSKWLTSSCRCVNWTNYRRMPWQCLWHCGHCPRSLNANATHYTRFNTANESHCYPLLVQLYQRFSTGPSTIINFPSFLSQPEKLLKFTET